MARQRGLQTFNLSLIRYLMRQQNKGTKALSVEIEVTREHLSRVLNRQRPLSEDIGRRLSGVLGVSWEVIQKPETIHQTDLINLSLVGFLHEPGALDWKNAIRLADKMGMLKRGTVESSEPTDAEVEDADLLALGDAPAAVRQSGELCLIRHVLTLFDTV